MIGNSILEVASFKSYTNASEYIVIQLLNLLYSAMSINYIIEIFNLNVNLPYHFLHVNILMTEISQTSDLITHLSYQLLKILSKQCYNYFNNSLATLSTLTCF